MTHWLNNTISRYICHEFELNRKDMSAARHDTLPICKLWQLELTDNLGINAPNRIGIGHFINRIDQLLIWFEIKSRLGIE